MRLRPLLAVAVTAVVVATHAVPASQANIECRSDTGFPPGNPSAYVCGEPGTGQPLDECYRFGVRLATGYTFEGRHCL